MKGCEKASNCLPCPYSDFPGGYCGYRFLRHEQSQNEKLDSLQAQISLLSLKLQDGTPAAEFTNRISDNYDYLAIGNSITRHAITDFWWSECGMAASEACLDYYRQVAEGLETTFGSLNSAAYNYSVWEVQAHDRSETYEFLDEWLAPGIDLVTVQLSENCSDMTTFEDDFVSLISHIQEICGDGCKVLVIDDFWDDGKHDLKKSVCEVLEIPFVDLSDIRGDKAYMAEIGAAVFGDDGEEHVIEHNGVAAHPGDEGMAVIADRILEWVFWLE